jgi:TnpA family transposase
MDERELARHHTLSEADLAAVSVRRGAANRLGFAVQLCLLRYPRRPLKPGEGVPRPIVEFVASQVGADPFSASPTTSTPSSVESNAATLGDRLLNVVVLNRHTGS